MHIVEFTTEELWDIVSGKHEFAHIVQENTHREGWYIYYEVIFQCNGVMYSFAYKEHTSPNVAEREIVKESKPLDVQPVHVNPDEEARFIWKELMKSNKGYIGVEDIKEIIELQGKYLESIDVFI